MEARSVRRRSLRSADDGETYDFDGLVFVDVRQCSPVVAPHVAPHLNRSFRYRRTQGMLAQAPENRAGVDADTDVGGWGRLER